VQQQAADRIGRARAIVGQLGEIGIARLGHVLAERREQVVERRERQAMRRHRLGERGEHRPVDGVTARQPVELAAVGVERGEPLGGAESALVGDVVGAAREGVDRRHRQAQRARQQPGRDRKILVVTVAPFSAIGARRRTGSWWPGDGRGVIIRRSNPGEQA
jgi:hypothetical protein